MAGYHHDPSCLGQEANLEQVEKALQPISLLTEAVMVTGWRPGFPVCTAEEIADVIETLSLSYIDDDDSELLEVELEEELAGEDCVVPPVSARQNGQSIAGPGEARARS